MRVDTLTPWHLRVDDDQEKGLRLRVEALLEVLSDFADRIVTPVAIGLRTRG